MAKITEKIPFTTVAGAFVDEAEKFSPLSRRGVDGKFTPTGWNAKVSLTSSLHGAPFRFETLEPKAVYEALAGVLNAGFIAKVGPSALVTDLGVPSVGTVGSEQFVVLGDNLVALAPQWLLLENSVLRPGKTGQDAADIEFVVSRIIPGRYNEVLR